MARTLRYERIFDASAERYDTDLREHGSSRDRSRLLHVVYRLIYGKLALAETALV